MLTKKSKKIIKKNFKKASTLEENLQSIMNDPMCGCAGDFAEDYGRMIDACYIRIQNALVNCN